MALDGCPILPLLTEIHHFGIVVAKRRGRLWFSINVLCVNDERLRYACQEPDSGNRLCFMRAPTLNCTESYIQEKNT
jgi:hypothetical protein